MKYTGKQIADTYFAAAKTCVLGSGTGTPDEQITEALAACPEGHKLMGMLSEDQAIGLLQGIVVGLELAKLGAN